MVENHAFTIKYIGVSWKCSHHPILWHHPKRKVDTLQFSSTIYVKKTYGFPSVLSSSKWRLGNIYVDLRELRGVRYSGRTWFHDVNHGFHHGIPSSSSPCLFWSLISVSGRLSVIPIGISHGWPKVPHPRHRFQPFIFFKEVKKQVLVCNTNSSRQKKSA